MKLTKLKFNTKELVIGGIIIAVVAVGTLYGITTIYKLPINLPFKPAQFTIEKVSDDTKNTAEQWKNLKQFVPEKKYTKADDAVKNTDTTKSKMNIDQVVAMFPMLDKNTLESYINNNPECISNGCEKLLIDEVDLNNPPTGIKTTNGDDVLAIDVVDGIMIVGKDVASDTGTSKVKITFVKNMNQLDMSLVDDLGYWSVAQEHAEKTGAILAVNCSGYNWHDNGGYASVYGALKYHGNIYRKALDANSVVNFDQNGLMSIGTDINNAYNSYESSGILIKSGADIGSSDQARCAQSAIGQTQDGMTILLVASGGTYGSNFGITSTEMHDLLKQYNAYNAAGLSGGSRTIMYWSGRIVNETVQYPAEGVRIPNCIIVKPAISVSK